MKCILLEEVFDNIEMSKITKDRTVFLQKYNL